MGKKISKNKDQKHQFQSLIKVLRPPVYITDSSTFKNPVQELTGKFETRSSATPSPPVIESQIIHIEDEGDDKCSSEVSSSFDVSMDSLKQQVTVNEEKDQRCNWNQMCMEKQMDLAAVREI